MFDIFKKKKEPESKLMIEANEEILKRRLARPPTSPYSSENMENMRPSSHSLSHAPTPTSHISSSETFNSFQETPPYPITETQESSTTFSHLPDEFPGLNEVMKNENNEVNHKENNNILEQILIELKTLRSQNNYILSILQKLEKKLE